MCLNVCRWYKYIIRLIKSHTLMSNTKCIIRCTLRRVQYHFHWSVPRPKGSLSILILHSISATIVFIALQTIIWHIQYKCMRSVLLVKETGGPGENHPLVASHWQTLSHNAVHITLIEIWTHNISGDRH
jgi:hypothetical protein